MYARGEMVRRDEGLAKSIFKSKFEYEEIVMCRSCELQIQTNQGGNESVHQLD